MSSPRPAPRVAVATVAYAGLAVLVVSVAVTWGGGRGSTIPGLPSAGIVVATAIPVMRVLGLLAATGAGALLLTILVLEPHPGGRLAERGRRLARRAALTLALWSAIALAQCVLAAADLLGLAPQELLSTGGLMEVLGASAAVRSWIVVALLALVAAIVCRVASTVAGLGAALALALLAVVQPSLSGHASGTSQHSLLLATTTVHAVAAVSWAAMTASLWMALSRKAPLGAEALRRQRLVSTAAAGLLITSGVGNGVAQVGAAADLWTTRYGHLVLLKAALTLLAVALGALLARAAQRSSLASMPRRALAVRACVETATLVAAMGVGAALALSPPTRPRPVLPTAAERSAGFTFPPPPNWHSIAIDTSPDAVFLTITVTMAVGYLAGVLSLRRRGVRWPPGRTLAWLGGVALLLWLTNFGIAQYANIAAGFHMGRHMVLTMLVPILLVMGAPATLALRALRPAAGNYWGPREWVVRFLHSKALATLTHPAVVLVVYFSGLYGLYLTSAFATLMSSHVGHVIMQLHFVLSGYLFYWILIGVDPRPRPLPFPYRFIIMVIASALHGFFAVTIMMSGQPLASQWFGAVRPPWIDDLLADTTNGGQVAWAMGEFPLAVVAITLAVQWSRDEDRIARRLDRRAARTGNQDLREYNAYLARLAAGTEHAPGRSQPGGRGPG